MATPIEQPRPRCGHGGPGPACTLLLAVLLAGLFTGAGADEARPATAAAPAAEAKTISAGDVVQRLDAVNGRLLEINEYLRKPAPDLAGIAVALPVKTREAQSVLGGVEAANPSGADMVTMAAALQKLRGLDRIFDRWRLRLRDEVALLDPWREQLRADEGFLRDAAGLAAAGPDEPRMEPLPAALRTRLSGLADQLQATREPLGRRLDVVVAADVRVGELQASLRDLEAQLNSTRLGRQEQAFVLTAPPLWKLPPPLRPPLDLARQNIRTLRVGIEDYVEARPAQLTAFGLILLALFVAVARLRRSILAKEGDTPADELLTHYPYAVTLLVWALLGPFLLLPELPLGISLLRGILAAGLLWRILPALVPPEEARPLKGLLLLAIAYLLQLIFLGENWYARLFTVVLGLLSLLVFRQLAQGPIARPGGRSLFRRAIHAVAKFAPAVVLAGLIAEIVGAQALGQQAIGGIVFISLALCALLAVDAILSSILDAWVDGPGGRLFRSVRHWPDAVRAWGRRLVRLSVLIIFVSLLPAMLPILEPLWNAISHFLSTAVTIGNLQLALGDVLWFFAGITLALGVARFARFLLNEDVLPRLPLAAGAASAASRLIYYALVVAGILFALAASGVELSKLTLVISALGVGIGFGLQNIVNNFVSGLILAFERPVREGDLITLGETLGRVQLIGLRATRIRTPDGAEVIVPNANLISGELTNWTLSDRARRIDVTVGVSYASDPVRVQQILLKAVSDLSGLASNPEPTTLFRGFGNSSLDFSLLLWTRDADDRLIVESEARVRVFAALREAGIEIPFPQMDVHMKGGS